MKKGATALFATLAFFWLVPFAAFAQQTSAPRVFDEAALFSEAEKAELESEIAEARSAYPDMDVAIVTTNTTNGKTAQAYADDFYEENGIGEGSQRSGLLLLIDMGGREVRLSGAGKGMRYFTDQRMENILDEVTGSLSEGDYAAAGSIFLQNYSYYMEQGIPSDQYLYDPETGKISRYRTLTSTEALIFAAISLLVGAGCCGAVAAKYQLKLFTQKYPLWEKSRIELTKKEDQFINQIVTSETIPRDNDMGGGPGGNVTTTHTSSSGMTHSGAGRNF